MAGKCFVRGVRIDIYRRYPHNADTARGQGAHPLSPLPDMQSLVQERGRNRNLTAF